MSTFEGFLWIFWNLIPISREIDRWLFFPLLQACFLKSVGWAKKIAVVGGAEKLIAAIRARAKGKKPEFDENFSLTFF